VTSVTIRPQVTLPNSNSNIHTNAITNNGNRSSVSSNSVSEACRDIHCDFDATCELGPDNFPRCSCQFDCASAMGEGGGKPVCASDMRMYPSICVMKMEGCQRQEELRLRPLDLCEGVEWSVA
jgi:coxsackievirus/adenovirus receptor